MDNPLQKTVFCFLVVENKILLLERTNTWFENKRLCPPGGNIDIDESPLDAAVRETFEETGLSVDPDKTTLLKRFSSQASGKNFENFYFLSLAFSGKVENKEPGRHVSAQWYDINDLPSNTSDLVIDTLVELPLFKLPL